MKTTNGKKNIAITLCENEAIVLLEWLYNFNRQDHPELFQDQSEERILFDLEAELEKVIYSTFQSNYNEILLKARKEIRDQEK